jgi:hypothetical protein
MGSLQLVSILTKGWRYISTGLIVYFLGMGTTRLKKNGNLRGRLRVVKHEDDADFGGGFSVTRLKPGSFPPRQSVRQMTPTSFLVQSHTRLSRLEPQGEKANNL